MSFVYTLELINKKTDVSTEMLIFHLKKTGKKFKNHTLSPSSESGGGKGLLSRGRGEGGGGINDLLSHPPSYLNPSPLSKPPSPLLHYESIITFFPATISNGKSIWNERKLQCCVLIPFLTAFDFKFEWLSRTSKCLLTSSIISGSNAAASHLFIRMKMFGLERHWLTLCKKVFSCK